MKALSVIFRLKPKDNLSDRPRIDIQGYGYLRVVLTL